MKPCKKHRFKFVVTKNNWCLFVCRLCWKAFLSDRFEIRQWALKNGYIPRFVPLDGTYSSLVMDDS